MKQEKTKLEELRESIYAAFSLCSQSDVNLARQMLELICEQDGDIQSRLVQYVCELWGRVQSSEEVPVPEIISHKKYEQMKYLYGDVVNAILESRIRQGLQENWDREQFYGHLWEDIRSSSQLCGIDEKSFALYYVAIDLRTPYYNVGTGLKMSNDRFKDIADEIQEEYREFIFVSALRFPQKTMCASLILNIINRLDSEEKKIVLLAKMINCYNECCKLISRD